MFWNSEPNLLLAIKYNRPELVSKLVSRNINIGKTEIYLAVQIGNLEILKILADADFDSAAANIACACEYIEILNWLESKNILPDKYGVRIAKKKDNVRTLAWLNERNICEE